MRATVPVLCAVLVLLSLLTPLVSAGRAYHRPSYKPSAQKPKPDSNDQTQTQTQSHAVQTQEATTAPCLTTSPAEQPLGTCHLEPDTEKKECQLSSDLSCGFATGVRPRSFTCQCGTVADKVIFDEITKEVCSESLPVELPKGLALVANPSDPFHEFCVHDYGKCPTIDPTCGWVDTPGKCLGDPAECGPSIGSNTHTFVCTCVKGSTKSRPTNTAVCGDRPTDYTVPCALRVLKTCPVPPICGWVDITSKLAVCKATGSKPPDCGPEAGLKEHTFQCKCGSLVKDEPKGFCTEPAPQYLEPCLIAAVTKCPPPPKCGWVKIVTDPPTACLANKEPPPPQPPCGPLFGTREHKFECRCDGELAEGKCVQADPFYTETCSAPELLKEGLPLPCPSAAPQTCSWSLVKEVDCVEDKSVPASCGVVQGVKSPTYQCKCGATVAEAKFCDALNKPPPQIPCEFSKPCEQTPAFCAWVAAKEGECSATCGSGIQNWEYKCMCGGPLDTSPTTQKDESVCLAIFKAKPAPFCLPCPDLPKCGCVATKCNNDNFAPPVGVKVEFWPPSASEPPDLTKDKDSVWVSLTFPDVQTIPPTVSGELRAVYIDFPSDPPDFDAVGWGCEVIQWIHPPVSPAITFVTPATNAVSNNYNLKGCNVFQEPPNQPLQADFSFAVVPLNSQGLHSLTFLLHCPGPKAQGFPTLYDVAKNANVGVRLQGVDGVTNADGTNQGSLKLACVP